MFLLWWVRRGSNLPTRAVSERDLTRSNSLSSKSRGDAVRGRYASAASPASRRGHPASDISRPSSAASTVDMSPEEYPTRDDLSFLDLDNMPCKYFYCSTPARTFVFWLHLVLTDVLILQLCLPVVSVCSCPSVRVIEVKLILYLESGVVGKREGQ